MSLWFSTLFLASLFPPGYESITVQLTDFNRCSWIVNLANSKSPHKATNVYFNEKGSYDVEENLKHPDITKFLHPVHKGESTGYFVFPYFVLIRASCDAGHYDTSFYQVIMHGNYPTVTVEYQPANARAPIRNSLRLTSFGGVVNLHHDPHDPSLPENPLAPNCYAGMCYPAFVVPQVFLNAPIVSVTVEAVGRFQQKTTRIYVSPYHSRKTERLEDMELIGPGETEPDASEYFPVHRIGTSEDPIGLGVEVVEDLTDPEHFPLDKDDFFEPQYTAGSSPTVMLAGFYQPDLVIISDPEGESMRLVRWTRNPTAVNKSDGKETIFDHGLTCNLAHTYGNDPDYPIPRFTTTERRNLKSDWLDTHYRKRYQPLRYFQSPVPNAIFDVVSLEDRLLLVTNSGLVSFYGITNITVEADVALNAPDDEKLRRCIKLVRAARFTHEDSDLVVAATYEYDEIRMRRSGRSNTFTTGEAVRQEIYYGRLTTPGKPMDWQKLGESSATEDFEHLPNRTGTSQVDAICYIVMDTYFSDEPESTPLESCWLIDATPAVGVAAAIQVLVEMTLVHVPTKLMLANNNAELGLVEDEAHVTFFIIAQHTPRAYFTKHTWEIISVLPKRPCMAAQAKSMTNIENLDTLYFNGYDPEVSEKEQVELFKINCHVAFRPRIYEELHISRMTYTRQNTAQVYIYGNRLLHSTNAGGAFAYLPDFPSAEEVKNLAAANREFLKSKNADERLKKYRQLVRMSRQHVIKVIAFSSGAHFAFLTSSRHLYLGSSGTLSLIRLRPSPGYSMIRLIVSNEPGLHDGRPFSILFDSDNKLFEMIAVVSSNKTVTGIRKRQIPWDLIVRNTNFVSKLRARVGMHLRSARRSGKGRITDTSLESVFTAKTKKMLSTYCPYGDYRLYQNYSVSLRRMQQFVIRPPMQHLALGQALTFTALMAFQASAYSLIHVTYLRPRMLTYSREYSDPFEGWVSGTQEEANLGFFRFFSGDPYDYGIIVDPSTFKRIRDTPASSSQTMLERYYLDYNQVILIQISFSVTTKGCLDNTDYENQRLASLQVTVDNGNGSIVNIETEKVIDFIFGAANFKIFVSINKKTAGLQQVPPGDHSTVVPLTFHLVNSFGKCVQESGSATVGDSIITKVYAGCPPGKDLQLNGNLSLRSLRFRNPKSWYGMSESECPYGEEVCFYVDLPVILHFDSFDAAKQNNEPYLGNYTMRIIGGGNTVENIVDYTEEEQLAYNIPGTSDVALIWSEWDLKSNEKVKTKVRDGADNSKRTVPDVILKAGHSAIKWTCHTLSPCARVLPTAEFQAVYYFKIRISNRDVGGTFTSCLYERDFVIQLYGFQPSPEIQLIISLLFSVLILLLLYFMYLCCRNQQRVWRANRVKMYGWLQIIIDTLPKSKAVSDTSKEIQDQIRRDDILLSLQGHLGVPKVVLPTKRRDPRAADTTPSFQENVPSRISSGGSMGSSVSRVDSGQDVGGTTTLAHVHTRQNPATWTDMIYDQIIAKRLYAIVERNNEVKESILRKVELNEQHKAKLLKEESERVSNKTK